MRLIIIVSIIFFQINITTAQSWEQLNGGVNQAIRAMISDTINNSLYVGGAFINAGGDTVGCMAKWENTGWSSIGGGSLSYGPIHTNCGHLFAMTNHQDDLHIVTELYQYNNLKMLGRWNGVSWDSLSTIAGTCRGLYSYGDTLYVLGQGLTVDSFSNQKILGWNGTEWFSVIDESFNFGWIDEAHWYRGKLYVGGNFETASQIDDFAVWNGQSLQMVGSGFSGGSSGIADLIIYQDDLYVSGDFSTAAGDPGNNIARWNGNLWLDVGGGTGGITFPGILDMDIYNDKLYVCGNFLTAGGIPANKVARWDGQNWCGLGSNIGGVVAELEFYRDTLVIGFMINGMIDGSYYDFIAKWNRGDYVDTCTNLIDNTNPVGQNDGVIDLKIYPNPTSETLQIITESPINEIQIYNSIGQQVWQQ